MNEPIHEQSTQPRTAVALEISVLLRRYVVCKLAPGTALPAWTPRGELFSLTRTEDELSIVTEEDAPVPAEALCERGWRALKVEGKLDFALTGILASILDPLADAKIGIFAISTFDTDYVLVKQEALARAVAALRAAGHAVKE